MEVFSFNDAEGLVAERCSVIETPDHLFAHAGTYLPDKDMVILCGGNIDAPENCYSMKTGSDSWTETEVSTMNYKRAYFGMVFVENQGILAVGGFDPEGDPGDQILDTAEIYKPEQNFWQTTNVDIPSKTYSHCVASYGPNRVIVIGGYQNDKVRYIFS